MRYVYLFILCLNASFTHAQGVIYTHKTFFINVDDGVVVVPEAGNKVHMWISSEGLPAKIEVYDQRLEWEQEKVLPFRITPTEDLTIIPQKDFYYLYKQSHNRISSYLWKIDGDGNFSDETKKLKAVVNAVFKDTSIVVQLFSHANNIYMMGNIYYPEIKKIISTIVTLNKDLQQTDVSRYAFAFNHVNESLQRMCILPGQSFFLLKKEQTDDGDYNLVVYKIDLKTGRIEGTSFTSTTDFSAPEIVYNPSDSTTTVYSRMGRAYTYNQISRRLFLASLNDTLGTNVPPTTVRVSLEQDVYGAFASIATGRDAFKWLPIHGAWNMLNESSLTQRVLIGLSEIASLPGNKISVINASSFQPRLQPIDPAVQMTAPPGDFKLSMFDKKFRKVKDTIVSYKNRYSIEVGQYATFDNRNNHYLVVKEKFPSNGKDLLMLHPTSKGTIEQTALRVYSRYHFALPQMQLSSTGHLFIPYVTKREVGLARVFIGADNAYTSN